jgi:plastocyanin
LNKSLLAVFVSGALCAGAIGCGGGNDKSTGATSGGTTTSGGTSTSPGTSTGGTSTSGGETGGKQSSTKVRVSEIDFALKPAKPTVETGTVEFRIKNNGTVAHALEVEGPSGEKRSKDILPGHSQTLSVNFNKPGKYTWYCPIANHRKLGMKGRITVR